MLEISQIFSAVLVYFAVLSCIILIIRALYPDRDFNGLIIFIVGLLFFFAVGFSLISYDQTPTPDSTQWFASLFQNAGTAFFGALITFLFIEIILRTRQEKAAQKQQEALLASVRDQLQDFMDKQRLQELIRMMGSKDNNDACRAVDELRDRGWLEDGSLKNANLVHANLAKSEFLGADLEGVDFSYANLRGADFLAANLVKVSFVHANLEGVHWLGDSIKDASLYMANLKGAKDIKVSELREAWSLEGAILPDGYKLPGLTANEKFDSHRFEADWRTAFEEWAKIAPIDENGYILPAKINKEG